MASRNKIRLVALLAAIGVTTVLAASIGPVASGIVHGLHHGFASLSPRGQSIAEAIGNSLPYWLPGTVIALTTGVAWRRHQRREDHDGQPDPREQRQIVRPR